MYQDQDPVKISEMFGRISHRYDCTNRLISFGIDKYWRKQLLRAVAKEEPRVVYDLATGSGDVAFELVRKLPDGTKVVGMDFCQGMLDQAISRRSREVMFAGLDFKLGDCLKLPIESNSLDAITLSFGFRNFESREKGLSEMIRVLKPGGSLYILEFSQPNIFFGPFYFFYAKYVLPLLAGITTGCKDAYRYLIKSVEEFPGRNEISKEIELAGFRDVKATSLTFGSVALHEAKKPLN